MALFKILKGQKSKLPTSSNEGWIYVTEDSCDMHIFTTDSTRIQLNADLANKLRNPDTNALITSGTSTKPVYFSNGVPTEGSTYAGGTKVTLNGSSKGGSTASFYAPTSAGTSGYVLKSNGTGAPTWTSAALTDTTNVSAGNGLTGGGSANSSSGITLAVGAGAGISVTADAVKAKLRSETALTLDSAAATTTTNRVYPVAVDKTGYLAVNVPWTDNDTTYNIATASTAGLVKPVSVIAKPTINTASTTAGKYYHVQMSSDGNMFVNVPWTDTDTNYYHTRSYSSGLQISTGTGVSNMYVPYGTASQYGVVKPNAVRASAITATNGGTTSGRYYGVEMDSNGKLFVNVPWSDTNTDTTYSAGTGLSLSGTTFNHSNSVTAGTAQGSATTTLTFGGTFTIPTVTYDAQGHITGKGTTTMTMPANPNVDTKVTQAYDASTNANIPLLFSATSGITSTASRGNTTAKLNNKFYVNPSTGGLYATNVYGAVWNDYAEYRQSDCLEAGRVICENGDDTLSLSTERLQPGAEIVSDTFGFAIGKTDKAQTPIAVSGRVLAYTYEDRNFYKPGDAVCAAPGGTVSKMTREEIREYPERIVGTVSAIPEYETWGEGDIPVNGRIWIKVK